MDRNAEKLELEWKLRQCRDLLVEYPAGPINETLRDYIVELESQIHDLDAWPFSCAKSNQAAVIFKIGRGPRRMHDRWAFPLAKYPPRATR